MLIRASNPASMTGSLQTEGPFGSERLLLWGISNSHVVLLHPKAKGRPLLYNLYDNSLYSFRTPSFGDDDELGIKLASVVQN